MILPAGRQRGVQRQFPIRDRRRCCVVRDVGNGRTVEDQLEKLIGKVGGFPGHGVSYVGTLTNGLGASIRAVTIGVVRRTNADALKLPELIQRQEMCGRQALRAVIRESSPGDPP